MSTIELPLNNLFTDPTLPQLMEFPKGEFDGFVRNLFLKAGYTAFQKLDNAGAFFELKFQERPVAVVLLSYSVDNSVGKSLVQDLINTAYPFDVPKFLLTRTDFNGDAYTVAATSQGKLFLINGDHLLRYHHYLQNTRLAPMTLSPLSPQVFPFADTVNQRLQTLPRVLVVANNRGGIGKTTPRQHPCWL